MAQVRVTITEDTQTDAGMRYAGDTIYVDEDEAADLVADDVAEVATEATVVGIPASFSFTPAQGAANVCEVTVQALDINGDAIAEVVNFDLWLSDAATGAGLTGTTASGAVAAKASSGTDLATLTSKKALHVQSKADGTYILSITDTAKTTFYPCAQVPGTGKTVVGTRLITANYG